MDAEKFESSQDQLTVGQYYILTIDGFPSYSIFEIISIFKESKGVKLVKIQRVLKNQGNFTRVGEVRFFGLEDFKKMISPFKPVES